MLIFEEEAKKARNTIFFIVTIITSLIIIKEEKYRILIIFFATTINFITKTLDFGAMAILSLSFGVILNILTIEQALDAFTLPLIWQIMMFLALSKALIKTGLSKRIALYFINYFGKTALKLNYGIMFLTTLFALIIPTSTARIGGIIIPIINSILECIDKKEENFRTNIVLIVLYSNTIASTLFINASSGNFYIQEILKKNNIIFTGLNWTKYSFLPSIFLLLILPYIINYFYPNNTKNLKQIEKNIEKEINLMKNFSLNELITIIIFLALFLFLIFELSEVNQIIILFIIVIIFTVFDIINWEEDITGNKEIWSVFLWVSNILLLSSLIRNFNSFDIIINNFMKFIKIFPDNFQNLLILVFYGYTQYLFTSSTVHIASLYEVMLKILLQNNFSKELTVLTLSYISNLFSGLTPYSSTEVILLNKTYNFDGKKFLKNGFIISTILFIGFFLVGMLYWRLIGVYICI